MNLRPTSIARQKIPFQPRFWLWDSGTLSCLLLLLDCFPYTRHPLTVKDSCRPWFSQTPGFCWAGAGTPGLFKNIVLVIGSLRSVWIRLFARDCGGVCSLGFPTPNREAECLVRKEVGLWTNFWAVATPVPASLSHPIPTCVVCYAFFCSIVLCYLSWNSALCLIHSIGLLRKTRKGHFSFQETWKLLLGFLSSVCCQSSTLLQHHIFPRFRYVWVTSKSQQILFEQQTRSYFISRSICYLST